METAVSPCRGWMFVYKDSNVENALYVFHLDLPAASAVPLGCLVRPHHSSEIHAVHWTDLDNRAEM